MQETKLNLEPYFDDFNKDKKYHKVLFKPGYPVQSRELTTLQSILQHQVERFGQHVFKEGSVVIPGQVGYDLQYNAVLVQNLISGIEVEGYRTDLVGKTLTGVTSQVKAKIINTISAEESDKNVITLYVKYVSSGNVVNNVQLTKFLDNEVLVDESNNQIAITTIQNSTAYTGSAAYITPGVYFIRGFFVEVSEQSIILDQYSNFPSYKVGLNIEESIVGADEDSTLFDNAIGSSNFSAPGADRLKIDAVLSKQDLLFTEYSNFIELLRLQDGKVIELVSNSVYSELEKNLARRTFDESGNYSIADFKVNVRETYNDGENNGVYTLNQVLPDGRKVLNRTPVESDGLAINGKDYYTVEVSSGKAYVKGFEINNRNKKFLTIQKPRTSSTVQNRGSLTSFGNYFELETSTIQGSLSKGTIVSLRQGSTVIGQARALSLVNGPRLYLTDISIYTVITTQTSPPATLSVGDFIFASNGAQGVVQGISGSNITLYQVSGTFTSNTTFTNSKTSDTSNISAVVSSKVEYITNVNATGFSADVKLESITLSGSSFTVSGQTITGIGTNFTSEVFVPVKLQIGNTQVTVSQVTSSTVTFTGTVSAGTYYGIKKLVPRIKFDNSNFYINLSNSPVKSSSDFIYYKTRTETKTVTGNQITLSTTSNEAISTSDIIINATNSAGTYTATALSSSTSNVAIFSLTPSVSDGTTVQVTYKIQVGTPQVKTKVASKFKFLIVNKQKNTTNTAYGTRISDNDISLKFSDVYKVHAIHEIPTSAAFDLANLFDKLVLNDVTGLSSGDVLEAEGTRVKILNIDAGRNTVYVKYLTSTKFATGQNLAIAVTVLPSNVSTTNVVGKFITSSTSGLYKDISENFTLVKNDTAESYNISKLTRLKDRPIPQNSFVVVFDYFDHGDTNNVNKDFYTTSSYNLGQIDYQNIPSTYDGVFYTDIIDFRYETPISSIGSTDGSLTNPFVETVSSLDLYRQGLNKTIPNFAFPGQIVNFDYDYYLGRIDKIYLDENNNLSVVNGSPSLNPGNSTDVNNNLLLATINIPPYMKSVDSVSVTLENNRRYTMKDIGSIDRRLENVENYTSLNLLEVNTNTLNILDAQGNNRFKNGFIADNFKTLSFADLKNVDYTASIDTENALVRPYPYVNNISFEFDSSNSSTVKTGNIVTLPYEQISYITQPYSSRVENLQPFEVFAWIGEIQLNPDKDVWYDTIKRQGTPQQIDLTQPIRWLFDRSGAAGDQWGSWSTVPGSGTRVSGGTNVTDVRTGVNNSLTTLTQDIQVGDTVDSISAETFIRQSIVELYADKLKPNTVFHFFIDEILSDNIIYPKDYTGLSNRSGTFLVGETVTISSESGRNIRGTVTSSPNGTYSSTTTYLSIDNIRTEDGGKVNPPILNSTLNFVGLTSGARGSITLSSTKLKSNSSGILKAFIIIPANTYKTGTPVFKLIDNIEGIDIYGISDSSAEVVYDTEGTKVELTSNVVSLTTAQVTTTPIRESRTRFIPDPPPPPPPQGDPIAQSFFVEDEGGVFISSLDLFFQSKDSSIPVSVEIRTMENGTVTNTVVPYSISTVESANVYVSSTASVATRFTFPSLVYLNQGVNYAFVVRSLSKNYKIWVSRLSETDVTTGFVIDKQPYVGVLFKSANMSTWEADQYQDIKFTMNRAKFVTNVTSTCKLSNQPTANVTLRTDSLQFTSGSAIMTVFHPNHGMNSTQNYVDISGVVSGAIDTRLINALQISTTGTVSFADLSSTEWSKVNGNVDVGVSNPGYILIDDEIIKYTAISGNTITIPSDGRGQFDTIASSHAANSIVKCYQLNGIPLNQINDTHAITEVIDLDSYKITLQKSANTSLMSGGPSILVSRNLPFEEIQPVINIINPAKTQSSVVMESYKGSNIYENTLDSFTKNTDEPVQNTIINELSSPRIVISQPNTLRYLGVGKSSLSFNINMSTELDNISPMLDVTGSSAYTISNRILKKTITNGDIDVSAELLPSGGKYSSYICKKVSLQNSSTSIKVLLDAVRKQGSFGSYSDIKVFVKMGGKGADFNSISYVEVPALSYPTSTNSTDYRAFDFELKNQPEFTEFAIKICMISADQTNVPKIRNFRAIALAV